MGYNIGIGQAVIEKDEEYGTVWLTVEDATDEEAPDLGKGDISGKTNYRYPSYTAMSNFVEKTGLKDVFYELNEYKTEERKDLGFAEPEYWQFKGGHPGITLITPEMHERVAAALAKWRLDHPDAVMPNPENTKNDDPLSGSDNGKDYTLGRLVWFEFWMRRALETCTFPAIYNS